VSGEPYYYRKILAWETVHSGQQFEPKNYGASLKKGDPKVECVCPEGIGLAQVDNNHVTAPYRYSDYVRPEIFWSWQANLHEGMKRFDDGKSGGIAKWNADYANMCLHVTGNTTCAGGSPLAPSSTPSGCSFSFTPSPGADGSWAEANAIRGYNSGAGGARYYRWSGTAWTAVDNGNNYVTHVCATTAL
jgi:hypothetical protein